MAENAIHQVNPRGEVETYYCRDPWCAYPMAVRIPVTTDGMPNKGLSPPNYAPDADMTQL